MAEDYSNMSVKLLDDNGGVIESYNHPRLTLIVLAHLAGMSLEEIMELQKLPEDRLQEIANLIGQEFIV